MKKICMITTISLTLKSFVVETAKYLHDKCGYDVTLICTEDEKFASSLPDYLHFIPVHMARGIDASGIQSIIAFREIFKREKFDLIQYSTPNAACYASIAARSIKAPIRLYCQWGIRYVGMNGFNRRIFKFIEKIICANSTDIRAVSPLNLAFSVREGLYKKEKAKVIGHGGTIGVDLQKFSIGMKYEWRNKVRIQYGIEDDDFVFGFAGRVSVDKGCGELIGAFKKVAEKNKKIKLLIVGPFEDNCGIDAQLVQWAKNSSQVKLTGLMENANMREYYSAMDVLVHPTYREGFGMVIQEAGALAVPVITTKIPGASEVMEDGISCKLIEPKNEGELEDAMLELSIHCDMTNKLGQGAYNRTKSLYDRPIMLENQRKDYEELVGKLHYAPDSDR